MIDRDRLENELAEVRAEKEQAIARANALTGAEQILLKLLSECEVNEDTECKPEK